MSLESKRTEKHVRFFEKWDQERDGEWSRDRPPPPPGIGAGGVVRSPRRRPPSIRPPCRSLGGPFEGLSLGAPLPRAGGPDPYAKPLRAAWVGHLARGSGLLSGPGAVRGGAAGGVRDIRMVKYIRSIKVISGEG